MKDVNKAEIKQQNRKAMPKFIVIMILSVLIGGAFGFCASYYGLNGFAGKLTAAGTYFSSRMAHWLLLALALVQPAVCLPLYFQGKRMVMHWDGEDDAAAEKAIIGQCAYKAYAAANQLCSALAAILAISALVFGTGALPSLTVCAVWMVMQCVYSREAMRLSRAGSQITE